MSHTAQIEFCQKIAELYPHAFFDVKALDVGSRDMSPDVGWTNRKLFTAGQYVGLDSMPGLNVDLIGRVHELDFPEDCLDTIVSTEMLEHDEFRALSLAKIVAMLKPGGHFLMTCAGPGRPVHGLDFLSGGKPYYGNVDTHTLLEELGPRMLTLQLEEKTEPSCDLYYFGQKM